MKQSKISASSLKALIRLDVRGRFGSRKDISMKDIVSRVFNILFSVIIYGVVVFGIYELTNIFVKRSGLGYEWLVMVTGITMILATIISIVTVMKNLYMSGDNELLLQFPVTSAEILVSKSIYCFIHNVAVCFILILPFYVSFGIVAGSAGFSITKGYYAEVIVDIFLISLIPFSLANILAVPVMMVVNKLKNKHLLMLIILIVLLVGVFVAYMEVIRMILRYFQSESVSIFSPQMIANYKKFGSLAYPFKWYANMLSGTILAGLSTKDIGLSFLYVALVTIGLLVAGFFVTVKLYYKTILWGIEGTKEAFKLKTRMSVHSQFEASLRREFLLIYRSFNYSFQYLAMAVAAPVMVYYCNNLAVEFGSASVGPKIVPGLSLLVIIIFSTMIVSFAATTISREGSEFYLTKIIPMKYSTQVISKFVLYSIVAVISVCLSTLAIGLAFGPAAKKPLIGYSDVFAIWGISIMMTMALTCLSVWADIKSPTFNVSGDGEMVKANKNLAIALFVGIIVAVGYGVFAIVFNYIKLPVGDIYLIDGINDVYIGLAIASILILAASACLLFVKLDKRYTQIVP